MIWVSLLHETKRRCQLWIWEGEQFFEKQWIQFWQVNLIVGKLRGRCADGVIQTQKTRNYLQGVIRRKDNCRFEKMAFHLSYTVLLKVGL